jgi:hypothetical protein
MKCTIAAVLAVLFATQAAAQDVTVTLPSGVSLPSGVTLPSGVSVVSATATSSTAQANRRYHKRQGGGIGGGFSIGQQTRTNNAAQQTRQARDNA